MNQLVNRRPSISPPSFAALLGALLLSAWVVGAPGVDAQQAGVDAQQEGAPREGAPDEVAAPGEAAAETAAPEASADDGEILVVELGTAVQPVAAEIIEDAIADANETGARAVILQVDTPGGLVTSTRRITRAMLASEIPVVVWVGPAGAQAASAGFFLLMAGDVAAMAPGTNAGAAAVVGGQGQDIEGTMGKKVTEDSAAAIRSLAKRNGRPVELAEAAVLEARSYDADEALELGLIDRVAPSLPDLAAWLDGREVRGRTLETRQAVLRRHEPTRAQRFLGVLAIPDVAYLLLSLGSLGLLVEIYNPGSIFPGVVGAICLILGFFALSVLPTNVAGLALMGLALVLFLVEIKVTSYGLLSLAGVVSLVVGSLMLFESPDPALRVSLELVIAATVATVLVVGFLALQVLRARGNRVRTGEEGMIGETGRAFSALDPRGKVFVHGEIWHAVSVAPVAVGEPVEVREVRGMELLVRPIPSDLPAGASPSTADEPVG